MLDFHMANGAAATMAVRAHELQNPFGVVQIDGMDIVGFEEKPVWRSHINAGIMCLIRPRSVRWAKTEYCDMSLFCSIVSASNPAKPLCSMSMNPGWMWAAQPIWSWRAATTTPNPEPR